MREKLREAVERALEKKWHEAHEIVQQYEEDPTACWIHGVLHKIEGDTGNAQYWYRRAKRAYDEGDSYEELGAIAQMLMRR